MCKTNWVTRNSKTAMKKDNKTNILLILKYNSNAKAEATSEITEGRVNYNPFRFSSCSANSRVISEGSSLYYTKPSNTTYQQTKLFRQMAKFICTLLLPLFVHASASAQVVFYNEGQLTAKGNNKTETSIYINGDMLVAGNASNTSEIEVENTRIKLLGNFINDVPNTSTGGTVFVSPSAGQEGVFEFTGTQQQAITVVAGTNVITTPSKLRNYINFPNLEINNNKHVVVNPKIALKTKDIELTKGWLILDSQYPEKGIHGGNEVNPDQESVIAHLLVDGQVNYNQSTWVGKAPEDRGFIQVNLQVSNEGDQSEKSIIGFGSPFKAMRADYFMFNTLLAPAPAGFLANAPIIEPKTVLPAGKGYVVGIDLRGDDSNNYTPLPQYEGIIDFAQRSVGNYRFNRSSFAQYAPSNQVYGTTPSDIAYTDETLNTENVTIQLSEGYNYLANPYTSPLNIDKLLGNNEAQSTWGIQADQLSTMPQLRNRVWILAPNSVAESTNTLNISKYTYNYQVAMRVGGTYIDYDNVSGVTSIAPLQMFVVRAYPSAEGATITIPKSERVMGTSRFLRSAAVENTRRDDFILEFRDMATKTTDRLSLVVRTADEIAKNKNYANVERLVSTSSSSNNGATLRAVNAVNGDFEQSVASQIYTKDNTGTALSVEFLPIETTSSVQLYHIPSSVPQALQILGLRINTKDQVERIWLEDKLTNTTVEITETSQYDTYSNPTDMTDRFVIHLKEGSSLGEIDNSNTPIYAHYSDNKKIEVRGFIDTDMGNTVLLYDTNGRVIDEKQVTDNTLEMTDVFSTGVYIVKMEGSRTQSIKVVVK